MELTFARDARAIASAGHVLVVAPKACFGPRARGSTALHGLLGKAEAALALQLGAEATPGLLGGLATSRAGKQRLTVAALADTMSRHDSPARAEAIRKVTAAAGLDPAGKNAVLLVLDDFAHVLPACNAVGRALPTFTQKTGAKKGGSLAIVCALQNGRVLSVDPGVQGVVHAARTAACLVDTPPTELDPAAFAAAAKKMLRPLPAVQVREIVGDALLRARLGGIHAVGRCARAAPRLLLATLPGKKGAPHIALVGKGVTFDTGGLHIKARGSMETMKSDMGGAAAMLGAFTVLARHGAAARVSLLLCLAENAIGPAAYKPDDILTLHSGKTVEINNTDAEGRLLLADGCSYAARELGASIVLDAATLTGAQGVATGDLHAAVISNDAAVEKALLDAGMATGDLCWPLPFAPEFYRAEFQSPIADMRNSVKNRSNAQTSCAAEFVHWHLDGTKARWGHVDLAYPAFRSDRATGFGVALIADAVRRLGKG
ncbi:MAG: leucyl aminopeptidase family protein [Planctomycetota bacterium]|nr:leucyl aminopeptidase family protein [Planctomycetota bacterium]